MNCPLISRANGFSPSTDRFSIRPKKQSVLGGGGGGGGGESGLACPQALIASSNFTLKAISAWGEGGCKL